MTLLFTPYVGILLLNSLISALIGYVLLSHRNIPGKTALSLIMAAAVEVSLASAFEIASVGIPAKVFWSKIEYLGNQSGPVLFLIFTLRYTYHDEWLTNRNVIFLWAVPVLTMLLAATNEWHRLIWNSFTPSPQDSTILIYGHGVWYWVCTVFGYLAILTGCFVLLRASIRSPQLFRRQVGIIFAAAIVPGVGNLIYNTGFSPVAGLDTAPISFSLAMIIFAIGIFNARLLDLVPIARGSLIEHMADGTVVVDLQNRIADLNPAAQKLLPSLTKNSIGQSAENILTFWTELMECYQNDPEIRTDVLIQSDPPRYLDLHISPLLGQNKQLIGRLVVFQDITARREMEAKLAQNIEELKIINRIDLAITSGLDMEKTLRALHEQCSQVVPIDTFYVALYEPFTSLINIPIYYKDGQYQAGPSRDIHDRPGLIGSVIQARRTLYLRDGIESITRPVAQQNPEPDKPSRSYIGIPLTVRDQVIGVLSIQNHRANAYTTDQVHLLERIAVQAAIAIENARLYSEEQRLAIMDELTGIYNFRGLIELGAREVERSIRFDRPLAALFFDIDDFRACNNTYSHAAGNLVLQAVVQRCKSLLRSVDVFARYGGDEFVALLPETDLTSAEAVAKRLIEEVSSSSIQTPFGDLHVTISIGVTRLVPNITDLAALIDRANRAERQAKMGQKSIVAVVR